MKISIAQIRSFILIMLLPVVGFVSTFLNIRKNNQKFSIFLISLFTAVIMIQLPPFQDLSRRFTETYNMYSPITTYRQAISGHVDIIFYVLSLTLKKLNIPFFYASVIVVFSSVFNHLKAVNLVISATKETKNNKIRALYFIYFCFINILVIGLGLRMGWAVSFTVLGVTSYYFSKSKRLLKSSLLLILASLTHFAMILVGAILVMSCFIKLKRKYLVFFLFLSLSVGKVAIPFLLNNFSLGGLSNYALAGYINNDAFANRSTNQNEIIVNFYNYGMIIIILSFAFSRLNDVNEKFLNFIMNYLICCFLFSSFYIAFNRYLVETGIFFYLLSLFSNRAVCNKYMALFFVLAMLNAVFANIYLQRRPILLGEMWTALYTPPIILLQRSEKDFEEKFKFLNETGDWIGHEIGK